MSRFFEIFRRSAAPVALLGALMATQTASAGPIGFTVGGTTYSVSKLDESPGNVLAVNAQSALQGLALGATSTPFTVYYQANVILEDANGKALNVPGQVTVLAKFSEVATIGTVVSNGVTYAQDTFSLAANQSGSYFNFYYNANANASNDLSGKGFGTDAGGTQIFGAAFTPSAPSGQFQLTSNSTTNFDSSANASTDGYGSKQTVIGIGGTNLNLTTTFLNTSYFSSGVSLGSLLSFSSTNQTPFGATSPSQSFYDASTGTYVTPSLPTVNGQYQAGGPSQQDFQFLADGNSFFTGAVVPEPASVVMTLLGVSGAAFGSFVSRRRRAQA